MGLLNIFKGKSYRELEAGGDSHAQSGAWGRAKIDYEKALEKLDKASSENPQDDMRLREDAQRLEEKILDSKEKLALDHKKTAEEMLEAQYYEDALQYLNLALELTSNAQLTEELETRSQELKKTIHRGIQQEFAEFKVFDDETEDVVAGASHFRVYVITGSTADSCDENNSPVETVTYIKAGQLEETKPSKEYIAIIQQGYRDWGIV